MQTARLAPAGNLMPFRSRQRAIETVVPLLLALVTLVTSAAAVTIFAALELRSRRDEVRAAIRRKSDLAALAIGTAPDAVVARRAVADLAATAGVASVALHRAGETVAKAENPGERPAGALSRRLLPREIDCHSLTAGGIPFSLCVESDPSVLEAAVTRHRRLLVGIIAGSALAGLLAAALARAMIARRLRAVSEASDRAAGDATNSLRVPAEQGALGGVTAAVNLLLERVQERETVLRRRGADLEVANRELEAFAYSVSHDLRAPLGSIDGFTQALSDNYSDRLDEEGREYLRWIRRGCSQMMELIEGLLQMSRVARTELIREKVDLTEMVRGIASNLQQSDPARPVEFRIRDGVVTTGDPRLLYGVVENLMTNAWKFTRDRSPAVIEFGVDTAGGSPAYYVRDNGAGFDPTQASRMFQPFQRLHSSAEFEGTGIGLATVNRIIERHGGTAWAEGELDRGATVYFTTGAPA